MNATPWMDVAAASDYANRHRVTLWKALESGQLHGEQRMAKGKWSIRASCLDAWLAGQACEHQADTRRSA